MNRINTFNRINRFNRINSITKSIDSKDLIESIEFSLKVCYAYQLRSQNKAGVCILSFLNENNLFTNGRATPALLYCIHLWHEVYGTMLESSDL